MSDRHDYLLGTHDAELERLGVQHHVWRPRVLEAWRRAGVRAGSVVIDAGAGPGWASFDLAESVGREGRVWALERSDRYFAHLQGRSAALGLTQIEARQLDLVTDALPVGDVDVVWVRWVLAFISDPAAVLAKLARALKPGGRMVIHEYVQWDTHRLLPAPKPAYEAFTRFVLEDWRASGGDADVGRRLPELLPAAGLRVTDARTLGETASPHDVMWRWTSGFARSHADHLVAVGKQPPEWRDALHAEIAAAEADPRTLVVTPYLMEVKAERV